MNKPNAFVTGANRGIGFEIAKQLGEAGNVVWLGCRDEERGKEAVAKLSNAGLEAEFIHVDVSDNASVNAAAQTLFGKIEVLDVLVNNAGMHFGPPPPVTEEPTEQMLQIFNVNALGPVRVTQALLPLLRKAKGARVVMITSGLGSIAETLQLTSENWNVGFAGYCTSKAALNMLTAKFAKELADEGIRVNAVDPGLTNTDLGGGFAKQPASDGAKIAVELARIDSFGPTAGFFVNRSADKLPRQHAW
jgi:NAD(P)-dependent dehydrogenase (short-subunit alcohol dehydrogenase family)